MSSHILYTVEDFKTMSPEEKETNAVYNAVVDGGLNVCKICGEYEAGLDNPCITLIEDEDECEVTLTALKEITEQDYFDLAQNGARILFDMGFYRVLDGWKGDDQSYFIIDFSTERRYLIDQSVCYDLVTLYYCGGNREYLYELLNNITVPVNTAL